MKRLSIALLLALALGVHAQQPPDDDTPATAAAELPTDNVDAPPEETAGAADAPEAEALAEAMTEEEEAAPAEEDFDPEEEISEDFPVPLPSDI